MSLRKLSRWFGSLLFWWLDRRILNAREEAARRHGFSCIRIVGADGTKEISFQPMEEAG